ncbi:MAG: PilZ domain-containing protein [Chloroflexota bacterium]
MAGTGFLQLLGDIARRGRPVKFFNTYHGIPINYEGLIMSVEAQVVSALVHEYQIVCMDEDQFTYIQSDMLPGMLHARCIEVDMPTREVRLTGFDLATTAAGHRTTVRVSPKEPADAEIYNASGRHIPGILADVSTAGVGIVTFAAYMYGELAFEIGTEVFADVHLQDGRRLRFQGVVASVQERGKFTHRIGLKLQPESVSEEALRGFIAVRQEELLLELREKYQALVHKPRKKTGPLS